MKKIMYSINWAKRLLVAGMAIGCMGNVYGESFGIMYPLAPTVYLFNGEGWSVIGNKIEGPIVIRGTSTEVKDSQSFFYRCDIVNKSIKDYFSRYVAGYYMGGLYTIINKNITWPTGHTSKITGFSDAGEFTRIFDRGTYYILTGEGDTSSLDETRWRGFASGFSSSQNCTVGGYYNNFSTTSFNGVHEKFKVLIDVPTGINLTAGQYNLKMNMARGFYRTYSGTSPIPLNSEQEFARMWAKSAVINITANIINSCSVNSQVINLDHKSVTMGSADGNIIRGNIQLKCDYDTSAKYTLITDGSKTNEYAEVNLGNNWTSELSVSNGTSRSSSGTFTTSAGAATINVASKLRQNASSKPGILNGSGVLNISID